MGEGHHFTGFPPLYLFLFPELGEPKLLAADDDPPPTCLRGALAPTAATRIISQFTAILGTNEWQGLTYLLAWMNDCHSWLKIPSVVLKHIQTP